MAWKKESTITMEVSMSGVICMLKKDLEKIKVMELLQNKQLTQAAAAKRLRLTERQVRRIFKRYQAFGNEGVISKKIGQPSNCKLPQVVKNEALKIITVNYWSLD
jgi:hypothetical protein